MGHSTGKHVSGMRKGTVKVDFCRLRLKGHVNQSNCNSTIKNTFLRQSGKCEHLITITC